MTAIPFYSGTVQNAVDADDGVAAQEEFGSWIELMTQRRRNRANKWPSSMVIRHVMTVDEAHTVFAQMVDGTVTLTNQDANQPHAYHATNAGFSLDIDSQRSTTLADLVLVSKLFLFANAPARAPSPRDRWQSAIDELREMKAGWNGEGTIGPSPATIENVSEVSQAIRPASLPEFAVDDSDGNVSLTWSRAPQPAFVSLVFKGDGNVTIVARDNQRQQVVAQRLRVVDHVGIGRVLRMKQVAELVFKS